MSFAFEFGGDSAVNILVIGIGGAGGNAVNRMISGGVKGVDFVAINTDKQALNHSAATIKLQVGEKITKGLGAGSNPEIGRKAAEESVDEIKKLLEGANMVFITGGMGGGTGTGGAPIIARLAKDMGILTVGVVTRPFPFEGKRRIDQGREGIEALRDNVDALVIIPNERLKFVSEQKITLSNAFEIADNVLRQAVQSISELMTVPGFINLDFNDVSTIVKDAGYAHMGVGRAEGKDKAEEATRKAIESPLLETSINGARGVLLNITGSPDMGFEEVEVAASLVQAAAHPDAHIIFGASIDENLDDEMRITVVATGFDAKPKTAPEPTVATIPEPEPVPVSSGAADPETYGAAEASVGGEGVQTPGDFISKIIGGGVATPAAQPQPATGGKRSHNRDEDEDDAFASIMDLFKGRR